MDSVEKLQQAPYFHKLCLKHGVFDEKMVRKDSRPLSTVEVDSPKVVKSFRDAVEASGLTDGMTVSFHHHFREGDRVIGWVMDRLAEMGLKNLTLSASSLPGGQASLIPHIRSGVITRIETSGLHGVLGEEISKGLMEIPVVFRSHGGRALSVSNGELPVDVAFLAVPSSDFFGNANGYAQEEGSEIIFGSLGYARVDAIHAQTTVLITNNLVPYPNTPFGISGTDVDYIVVSEEPIGDPGKIQSGSTRLTKNPKELHMAKIVATIIEESGYFLDGFSLQLGSGGASLAVGQFLREAMVKRDITASFALGGITERIVSMHEEGRIKRILDVQSFDLAAAHSLKRNRFHQQITANYYASPVEGGAAVNQLDIVVLSALEVDVHFNVNALTGSDGIIRGAIGGHSDTASGAALAILVAPLIRGRIPTIVERVQTVVTPGKMIDIVVTDQGIAVNPNRADLMSTLKRAGVPLMTIEELQQKAERLVGKPRPIPFTDKIVGVVTYRDNSIIDVIRQIKE